MNSLLNLHRYSIKHLGSIINAHGIHQDINIMPTTFNLQFKGLTGGSYNSTYFLINPLETCMNFDLQTIQQYIHEHNQIPTCKS